MSEHKSATSTPTPAISTSRANERELQRLLTWVDGTRNPRKGAQDVFNGLHDALIELGKLRNSHAALVAALDGNDPEAPETIRPLSWLKSAINELRERGPKADDEDPESFWEMLAEVECLHMNASAALKQARGES